MVKKLKAMAQKKAAAPAGLFDNALAGAVKESAQQIWLAGMGAFSKAQAEGGKVFDALVKEGVNLQKKTQGLAEERISAMTNRMTGMAGEVQARAGQSWDKLESIFEARTAKALNKLGVPSAKDVEALIARIDELSAQVARLGGAPAKKAPARKAAPKAAAAAAKPAARKRATRKAAPAA